MAEIRVLLVEDDPSYVQLIEHTLAIAPIGFSVTAADTLREAQRILNQRSFNLILTALDLPDEKGLDTLIALRCGEPSIPIVVLTGPADEDLEQQAISHGAQFSLRKSEIDTQSLVNAMLRAVRGSRRRSRSTVDKRVNQLLSELEENIVAIKSALVTLKFERHDDPHRDAVHTIRSHIGSMEKKIGRYRQPERERIQSE